MAIAHNLYRNIVNIDVYTEFELLEVKVSFSCATNDCNESLVLSCPRPGGCAANTKYNKIGGPAPPVPFLGSVSSPPQFHGMIATPDTADHTCLKSMA